MKMNRYIPFMERKDILAEIALYGVLIIAMISFSSSAFTTRFDTYIRFCEVLVEGKIEYQGQIPPLTTVLSGAFVFMNVILLFAAYSIFIHYTSFRRGSMSIYTMKRIPDRMELHRRCLALPVMAVLIAVIIMTLEVLFFRHLYLTNTPAQILPPDGGLDIWRLLI